MESLVGIGAFIIGGLVIGVLFTLSMVSIDRNLKARETRKREIQSFQYRPEIYTTGAF